MAVTPPELLPSKEQNEENGIWASPGTVDDELDFIPLYDRIIVAVTRRQETRSGIILPDNSVQANMEGVIVAKGPGRIVAGTNGLVPLQCEIGDVVMFAPHDGRDILIDGKFYRIMPEDKVFGIVGKSRN